MKSYTQAELDALISCPKRIIEPPRKEMKVDRGTLRNDMKLESLDGKTEFIGEIVQSLFYEILEEII